MSTSILREKAFDFAVKNVSFCKRMKKQHRDFALFDQLLRSGTAPGALTREAQFAESISDFKHKLMIALKEANEAEYWLDLIAASYPNVEMETLALKKDCKEIIAILVSSTKTLKEKIKK